MKLIRKKLIGFLNKFSVICVADMNSNYPAK